MKAIILGLLVFGTAVALEGQGGAPQAGRASAPPAAARPRTAPGGDLAQLMRGILFPNSNLLFDVQSNDPGAPKKPAAGAPGGDASSTYASVYSGWQTVEGAAVAIEESADLILKPGRLCSNGKPVPVTRADFIKFAEALRETGRKTLAAAKEKNQEKVSDLTNDIADACSMCHEVYRDKAQAGEPGRCTP